MEGGREKGKAGDEGGGFMQAVSVGVGLPEGADQTVVVVGSSLFYIVFCNK